MLEVSLSGHIDQTLRQLSDVRDIVMAKREIKIRSAGASLALLTTAKHHVTEWDPQERKRPLNRPPRRWCAYAEEVVGEKLGRNSS